MHFHFDRFFDFVACALFRQSSRRFLTTSCCTCDLLLCRVRIFCCKYSAKVWLYRKSIHTKQQERKTISSFTRKKFLSVIFDLKNPDQTDRNAREIGWSRIYDRRPKSIGHFEDFCKGFELIWPVW